MTTATIILPDALAQTKFAGRLLGEHAQALAEQAGLDTRARRGPLLAIDGLFAAVAPESLRALEATLSSSGGVLRTPDGRVVATARTHADPNTSPRELLAHQGGEQIVVSEQESVRIEDPWTLSLAERAYVHWRLEQLAKAGVRLVDPARIWIEAPVEVQPSATLWPGVVLRGATLIRRGAEVRANCWLQDTVVGERSLIKPNTVCEGAVIGADCAIGPMAHLRPAAELDDDVRVGNFVEVKKSVLHRGVRAGHLSYLGDAEIGPRTNIGAGTITCNYDGWAKHKTLIGADTFIGSNSALVAPIEIGDGAIVGAGSTLSRSVPADALALGRGSERVLEGKAPSMHARNRARAGKSRG